MYGVPANLDLRVFHGTMVTQVCLGQHDVQFHFNDNKSNPRSINVAGWWELIDAAGEIIDHSSNGSLERPPYQLHRLIGRHVIGSEVHSPDSILLRFESGEVLKVYDNSKQYESFNIQPGNFIV